MNRRTLIGGFLAGIAAVLGKWTAPIEAKPVGMIQMAEETAVAWDDLLDKERHKQMTRMEEMYLRGMKTTVYGRNIVIGPVRDVPWSYQALDTINDPNKVVDFSDKGVIRIGDPEHIHLGPYDASMPNMRKIGTARVATVYNMNGDLEHWRLTSTGAHKIS